MKAQATAASMEPLSKVPTQTTEVIPPVAAASQQPEYAKVTPSDDLLALDTNPFQSNMNSILSLSANQPPAGQQWTAQPACKLMSYPSLLPCLSPYSSPSLPTSLPTSLLTALFPCLFPSSLSLPLSFPASFPTHLHTYMYVPPSPLLLPSLSPSLHPPSVIWLQ